jgi:uncharacterized protein YbcI
LCVEVGLEVSFSQELSKMKETSATMDFWAISPYIGTNQEPGFVLMPSKTVGQIEAAISEAVIKFEREYMGRGPTKTRTYLLEDLAVVRLEGVLTPAEQQLAKDAQGVKLLKEVRSNLIEGARETLKKIICDLSGRGVISMHSDISAKTGERIIVFTLE